MRQWVEDSARIRMREALESALAGSEPISLMAVARQLGCAPGTLRNYFPEFCQAIVARNRGRFDYQRIQQRLQEVLTTNEEVPRLPNLPDNWGIVRVSYGNILPTCANASLPDIWPRSASGVKSE